MRLCHSNQPASVDTARRITTRPTSTAVQLVAAVDVVVVGAAVVGVVVVLLLLSLDGVK